MMMRILVKLPEVYHTSSVDDVALSMMMRILVKLPEVHHTSPVDDDEDIS